MVQIGSGAEKEINDMLLTRNACYLVAQNGDSRKENIKSNQTEEKNKINQGLLPILFL